MKIKNSNSIALAILIIAMTLLVANKPTEESCKENFNKCRKKCLETREKRMFN